MNSSDEELDEVSTLSEQLNQSMLHSSATIQEVLMQNNFLQDFSQRLLARYNKERQRCSQLESALNLAQVTLERTQVLLQTSEAKVAALRISTKEFTEAIEAIEVCILQRIEGQLATAAKEKFSLMYAAYEVCMGSGWDCVIIISVWTYGPASTLTTFFIKLSADFSNAI